jgi:elongation factor Ts
MMEVSAQQVKGLRDKTGAGMMDCRRALQEAGGDEEKAMLILREKGLAKAEQRQGRTAAEGIICTYVHDQKLGVMLELNCETDFVARTAEFQTLGKELCMQIAAMKPRVVSREELPPEVIEQEKAIYAQQVEGKPPQVVEKIVQGKLEKFYQQVCLLDQPYIRDDSKTVKQLIDDAVLRIGEKLVVRRFVCMRVGEQLK